MKKMKRYTPKYFQKHPKEVLDEAQDNGAIIETKPSRYGPREDIVLINKSRFDKMK